ncbi:MAG: hypothetical protein JWR72_3478, partial [Flavisolibacter sp.]|nr:hypothetical protein [Flavisolibacter sp.]
DRLGLGSFKLARVVLGSSFEWMDLLAYSLGIIVVVVVEKLRLSINQGRLGTTSAV